MNKFLTFLKKEHLYLGICRYALGLLMLPYAISKILKTQFVVLPIHTWTEPLEKLSGISMAWSFLGYSPWFQVLIGILELIPALLLLFRRTTLLGAILMLPMTLNVFLINEAFNLWDSTKMISLFFLALNIIIFIFERKNVKSIILTIINKERKFKLNIWETIINVSLVGVITFFLSSQLLDMISQKNELTGDWYNKRPIEWVLKSEILNGKLLKPKNQKLYFGTHGSCEEMTEGYYIFMNYKLNQKNGTLEMSDKTDNTSITYNYKLKSDTLLQLKSISKSTKDTLTQVFRKRIINQNIN